MTVVHDDTDTSIQKEEKNSKKLYNVIRHLVNFNKEMT